MMTRRCQGYFLAVLFGALLNAAGVLLSVGYAQTNITSSGLGTTINGSTSAPCLGGTCTITGGDRRGQNLFHSFGRFDIGAGNTANFSNDSGLGTSNVIGRVTENQVSNIFGTIQTTGFGTANLFLMNPNGWIFGPTARLNVGGSFHATTANSIKLGTDGVVYADPTRASALTSAPPSAFGFLTANPGRIDVQAGALSGSTFTVLQVPPGDNKLSFVGGPVNVGPPAGQSRNGFLRAPGGRVNLVSVASAGEAAFDGSGFNVDSFQQLGQINITGGSIVDAKNVFIRGGDLAITSAAIFPGFFTVVAPVATSNGAPAPAAGGGEVNIRVANGVTIGGPFNLIPPGIQFVGPLGAGGSIVAADIPNITIQAGSFRLVGQPATARANQPQIQTARRGPGRSPLITISADTVEVRNGAFISIANLYANSAAEGAGEIVVNARDVTLSSDGNLVFSGNPVFTGLAAQGTFHPTYGATAGTASFSELLTTADSGSITINATGKLTMLGAAGVTTDSLAFGRSGNVTINARDVLLVGAGANTGAIAAQSILAGSSGNVTINATGAIDVQNGFRVSTNTGGSGDAGVVSLTGASITVTGADTRIQSAAAQPPDTDPNLNAFANRFNVFFFGRTTPPLNYSTLRALLGVKPRPGDLMDVLNQLNARGLTKVADLIPGDGGKVIINTPLLTLDVGARLETSTLWDGNAGAIVGDVGSLSLKGGASIRSRSGADRSDGVFVGTGSAGDVTFTAADTISISGAGSTMSTTTFGDGNAGSISLSANQVNVQNGGSVTSESGGTLAGQFFAGTGNAGQIAVSTPTLAMADGGRISVATLGAGSAGSILLNANTLSLAGGSQVVSSTSGSGQGGSVAARAEESIFISGSGSQPSGLFSTASSAGNAGQISVSTPTLIMGDGGTISVATSGAGNAGNVLLNANNFSLTGGAQVVSSTSGAGQGGSMSANASQSASISGQGSGLFSTTSGTGNAGQISVSTPTLTMGESGTISVATSGGGNAGNILLNVGNFTQSGGARVDSSTTGGGLGGDVTVTALNSASMSGSGTGLFSTASSTGAGGDIKIQGGQLVQLTNNATISAQSTGTATATAGNITINAPTFEAQNGSVTTGATLADGGNIAITTTGSLVQLTDSQITTSVRSGEGSGGNIAIDSQLIVLNNSQVLANAFGGPGGNINITGDVFLVNSGGRFPTSLTGIVDASSALSAPGTVNIEATFTNVVGTFAQLPSTPLQATELLRASCAARFAGGKASSLVLGGRDGLPLQPGDLLPSPLYVANDAGTPPTGTRVTGYDQSLRYSLLGSKDQALSQYSLLPNAKCSL
jgi:filamentous hemagglutinin family protein